MTRVEFSAAATAAIVLRATDARGRVRCEKCDAECPRRTDYHIDHIVAEGVRPESVAANDNRPPLTADDGLLLCVKCHARKTRRDVASIAKSNRIRDKHRAVSDRPTEIARRFGVKQEPDK
jgi:hypothetical protein